MKTTIPFHPETDSAEWALWAQRRLNLQVDALLLVAFEHPDEMQRWVDYLTLPTPDMPDEIRQERHHLFLLDVARTLRSWGEAAQDKAEATGAPGPGEVLVASSPMTLLSQTVVIDRLTALVAHRHTLQALSPLLRDRVVWTVLASPVAPHTGGEFGRFNKALLRAEELVNGTDEQISAVTSPEQAVGLLRHRLEQDKAPVKGVEIILARTDMEHRLAVRRARASIQQSTRQAIHDLVVQRRRQRLGLDLLPTPPPIPDDLSNGSGRRLAH